MDISRESIQKTVLVGVTGCIAVYKACELVRALQKKGYRVKVVMTTNATRQRKGFRGSAVKDAKSAVKPAAVRPRRVSVAAAHAYLSVHPATTL